MAESIQKFLNAKDADDVKKIVGDINSAKDPDQSVDGYVRLAVDIFENLIDSIWFIWFAIL